MSEVLVVANAPLVWRKDTVELVVRAETVLACDGGANHLARIGVRPRVVIGDMDSIRPSVRRFVGEERIILRDDQNFTDLHKTLTFAIDELGAQRMTVIAATGGRLDHALANLGLLCLWGDRARVEFVDDAARIFAVQGRVEIATVPGQGISLVPLGRVEQVRTEGLFWELAGEPLDVVHRPGVSNRATGERVVIENSAGRLLVFVSNC